MYFEYTQDCAVGVQQIDAEHKYLFKLMNHLMEIIHGDIVSEDEEKDIETYIELLIDYGKIHFSHEEAYMEEIGDIELAKQKRDHAMFLNRMSSLDIMDLNNAEKHRILEDTLSYLTKWLYNHIMGSDTLIGKVEHIAEHVMDEDDFCKFTEKYMTGVELIDTEHKGLFDIIGRAYRLVEAGNVKERYDDVMRLLDELGEYTQVHFAHEEELMEKIEYPYLDAQRRAHNIFMEKLDDKDFGENEDDPQKYLEDLLDFLYAWLGSHILKMDKPIGKYVEK